MLADTLRGQVQGNRPVTLVGFSLGARVIFACLEELASQGAYGLVEEVYLFGCPVMANKKQWEQISSVVSGRILNGYCSNDMMLGVLYRASSAMWTDVAGLREVQGVSGVESIDLKDVVEGHLAYRDNLPLILQKCGFAITSDYFEDEEDEEEQERLEAEQEKVRINEQKLREKEEKLRQKQAEYQERIAKKQEEAERKKAQRLKEHAIKMLEQEAEAKEIKPSGFGWFSRKSSTKSSTSSLRKTQSNAGLDLINDATDDFWQPKELPSTMPALIIDSSKLRTSQELPSPDRQARVTPSDLDFRMGEAGLDSLLSLDNNASVDSSLDQFVFHAGTRGNIGPGDIVDRKTDFEYLSDTEEGPKTPAPIQTNLAQLRRSISSIDSFSGLAPPSPSHTRERVRSATSSPTPNFYSPTSATDKNPWS